MTAGARRTVVNPYRREYWDTDEHGFIGSKREKIRVYLRKSVSAFFGSSACSATSAVNPYVMQACKGPP